MLWLDWPPYVERGHSNTNNTSNITEAPPSGALFKTLYLALANCCKQELNVSYSKAQTVTEFNSNVTQVRCLSLNN